MMRIASLTKKKNVIFDEMKDEKKKKEKDLKGFVEISMLERLKFPIPFPFDSKTDLGLN